MDASSIYGPKILNSKFTNHDLHASAEDAERITSKVIRPEQWYPWKSFGKLMDEAILEMGWQERYSILRDIVSSYGKEKNGHLTLNEFLNILNDNPITDEQYRTVFYNLMDRNQDGIVSEIEFTSGMLSLSPLAKNDPKTSIGQLRLQFIFLYYDTDRNGILNLNELKRMIIHISSIRSLAKKTLSMSESKAREYAIHLIAHYDGVFGFNAFYNSVKNNILKGTGWLLRTHLDLVDFINDNVSNEYNSINDRSKHESFISIFSSKNCLKNTINQNFNKQAQSKELTGLKWASTIMEQTNVNSGFDRASLEADKSQKDIKLNSIGILDLFPHNFQNQALISLEQRVIEYYMNFLTNFENNSDIEEKMYINNVLNYSEIMDLCDRAVQIIRSEDSLLTIKGNSSVRIFGGIHGQLIDLLYFFENFSWPHFHRGDILSMRYVFLGDYVDGGRFSLEVISILFSLKIMFPDKIFLLRGNHEDASINSTSGFHLECKQKFGMNGEAIWERINDAFEFFSISALIDDQVLCLHSGIGKSIKKIEHLSGIPKPIHVKSEELFNRIDFNNRLVGSDRCVFDCLWSEIIDQASFYSSRNDFINETDAEHTRDVDIFEKNIYCYDSYDIEEFMNKNSIKLIVKTNNYCKRGYEYSANNRVVSLNSATNFCNHFSNDAAVLVITRGFDNQLIQYNQIIKYQTIDNSFGWFDQINYNLGQNSFNHEFKIKLETSKGESHQFRELPDKKSSVFSSVARKTPNSSSTFNYSLSPKSSTRIVNTDEKPITPARIMNLNGRAINLTAF
ncbi:calcineurin like phosphatase with 3x Efhand domains at N-terminus [Cryptosporidium sp. chipmunk genotype I]|uniref:calcineurin like phosphatase with 3x Efhand domains at N-terminus n=1 Tax=Cryptosporidium sp. chipmunk genotype I TaxID=1280935 RepID=UPI003519EB04|nr:calcineurin like phosphatase with 3x Efhand domains at N-terminus [Cryptosporidium sp. chipmunk genotype I]